MTQEQKELLLKDLCARLPYGVICKDTNINITGTLSQIGLHYDMCVLDKDNGDSETCYLLNCKPYLFPLSSMTEEQCYDFYCRFVENEIDYDDFKEYYFDGGLWHKVLTSIDNCSGVIEWFHKNHFDYRGLIPMGLANDATDLNIY